MEEIKMIPFEDALRICANFINDPKSASSQESMEQLKKDIVIYGFLPIGRKMVTIYKILIDADKSYDLPVTAFTAGLELSFFFNGLLAYTNIDHNLPKEVKIYEVYDTFYQSGLADFIYGYCKKDYDRLQVMVDRSFNLGNLKEMMDSLKNLDTASIQDSLAQFKELQENLNPDIIQNIADIVRFNDPTIYTVKDELIDRAIEKLEKIDTLEKMQTIKFASEDNE